MLCVFFFLCSSSFAVSEFEVDLCHCVPENRIAREITGTGTTAVGQAMARHLADVAGRCPTMVCHNSHVAEAQRCLTPHSFPTESTIAYRFALLLPSAQLSHSQMH